MKQQRSLPLAEILVGMRVVEAVLDEGGHVLVPAGAEISESLLHGLQRREVAEICVEQEVVEDPAEREQRQARIGAQLDLLFRQAGDGLETRQLYQSVLGYRLEHGA